MDIKKPHMQKSIEFQTDVANNLRSLYKEIFKAIPNVIHDVTDKIKNYNEKNNKA